jgi:membrane-associated phospholipid phosphatase
MLAGLRPDLRTALLAGAAFILVATCSALGWLLPWDEPLLRLVVASRSCTSVALSSLASAAGAIEVVGVFTGLLVLVVALTGAGPRAAWLGMWVLSLPLELALKVGISHPLPPIAVPPAPLLCEGASPLTNPALSPFTDPTQYPLLNAEGAVLQPIGVAVGHTFPSGYTVRLAFFAVLAGYWLWSRLPPPWRTVTSGLLVIVALLFALSRLVVIWHWPSDVLGGLALGGALGCAAHAGWALTWPRPRST